MCNENAQFIQSFPWQKQFSISLCFCFQAAILQQTAEYIYNLEQEKTRLLSQNCQLKRLLNQHEGGELPPKKRKTPEVISKALEEECAEPVSLIAVNVTPNSSSTSSSTENAIEIKRQLEKVGLFPSDYIT